MKQKRIFKMTVIIFGFLMISIFCFADKKGEEIAKKHFGLKEPDDTSSNAKMILIDKNNNKQVRILKMFT